MAAASWMTERLAADAIPIERSMPNRDCEVVAWVTDAKVAIYNFPVVARWDGREWWTGLPGHWIALGAHRWTVTHWKAL